MAADNATFRCRYCSIHYISVYVARCCRSATAYDGKEAAGGGGGGVGIAVPVVKSTSWTAHDSPASASWLTASSHTSHLTSYRYSQRSLLGHAATACNPAGTTRFRLSQLYHYTASYSSLTATIYSSLFIVNVRMQCK